MATYTSKTDMVAATLRELIFTRELRPGTPLRQRDLAEMMGVSPTPVREALRRLESEGLVRCDQHRGSTVIEADQGATQENFQIRAALESLGAALATGRISDEEISDLEATNSKIAGVAENDSGHYAELNREFHFSIYECARSPMLLALMRLLWQQMHGGPRVLRTHTESAAQHAEIIEALRARDPQRAADLTREHILGAEHLELYDGASVGIGVIPRKRARRSRSARSSR